MRSPALTAAVLCAAWGSLGLASCKRPKLDKDGNPVTFGSFRIRTFPKGARGWVNGELKIQSTPATLILPAGEYHIRLQKRGAESLERTITIEAGEARSIDLRVPSPPPALLTVRSDVEGAEVRVNGYKRGVTPLIDAHTKPGPVDVTVMGPGRRAKSTRTHLKISESKTVEVFFFKSKDAGSTMETLPGYLTLGLKPNGVVETTEGQKLGETPIHKKQIGPGVHNLILRSKDGHYEKQVSIEIEPGQSAIYRFLLTTEDEVPGWTPPDAGVSDARPPPKDASRPG